MGEGIWLPPDEPPALAPPAFLSARVADDGGYQLAWSDNSDNEYAFSVWRKGGGSDWARVGVVPPNSTTFTDTGLAPATTYTYRVRATSSVASEWSNEASLTTPARPAAPTGLRIAAAYGNAVFLRWSVAGADETGLMLWRQTGGGVWQPVVTLPPGTNQYVDLSVSAGTWYAYRVQAVNNDYASVWSNTVNATTPG